MGPHGWCIGSVPCADAEGRIDRVYRVYDAVDFQRKVEDQPQEARLRGAVRHMVLSLPRDEPIGQRPSLDNFPYSPDGPLQWTEIKLRSDAHLRAAAGWLSRPGSFKERATWEAPRSATAELTGLQPLESGKLVCTYNRDIEFQGKRLAEVEFNGTVVGRTEDGRSRNQISGGAFIELKTRRLQSLRALGQRQMLDQNDKVIGTLSVDYQHVITPIADDPDLADKVVATIGRSDRREIRFAVRATAAWRSSAALETVGFGVRRGR